MKKKHANFLQEFKTFITRGSVLDMAVGIIIGGAFTAIVTSLVTDILNPLIGWLLGEADFSHFQIVLKAATDTNPEIAIRYGLIISAFINFILVAFVLFLIIKAFNHMNDVKEQKKKKRKGECDVAAPAPEPAPPVKSEEVVLLEQIRDLLKK